MEPNLPEQDIDQPFLTELVQKVLDRPVLQITDWKIKPVQGGFEWDSAIFRYQGEAKDGGETIPWSLILKSVKPTEKAKDPGGIWYWKREALAYQSGMLGRLLGGNVTAPACYEVQERPDGSIWLWLEDVKEDVPTAWQVDQYGITARHLGQFNGGYLTGETLPSEPWITRNWLRKYVENAAPMVDFIHNEPNHRVVMNVFPGDMLAHLLPLWDERSSLFAALENLPQFFCHQDAFRRNLFIRRGRTLAIDWSYMGIAPVGAELAALVAASTEFFDFPADRISELGTICFEGYLQGLGDAGWKGDTRLVRTGYVVSLLLRYPVGAYLGEAIPAFLDAETRLRIEKSEEISAAELEKSDLAIVTYYLDLIPEAWKLLGA